MTIRIRPHHLLCMLTFAGKGYSPEFVANFERVAQLIASGEQTIRVVFSPDDICNPLLADADCHCRQASVAERDRLAAESLSDLLGYAVRENAELRLDPDMLDRLREAFAAGTIRKACRGCQWAPLCDEIAKSGFGESRLMRAEPDRR